MPCSAQDTSDVSPYLCAAAIVVCVCVCVCRDTENRHNHLHCVLGDDQCYEQNR